MDIEQGHLGSGSNSSTLKTPTSEGNAAQPIPSTQKSSSELRRLQILKDLGYNYNARGSATTIETDPQSISEIVYIPGSRAGIEQPRSPSSSSGMAQVGDGSIGGREDERRSGSINGIIYASSDIEEPRLQTPTTVINTSLPQSLRPDVYSEPNIRLPYIHPAYRSKYDVGSDDQFYLNRI